MTDTAVTNSDDDSLLLWARELIKRTNAVVVDLARESLTLEQGSDENRKCDDRLEASLDYLTFLLVVEQIVVERRAKAHKGKAKG